MKLTILFTTLLALAPTTLLAAPSPSPDPTPLTGTPESLPPSIERRATLAQKKKATDTRMFSNSLNTFISHRKKKNPSYLTWSSDGCSKSPDKPFGWNFVKGCYRHDFGYRNFKNQKRFTKAAKAKIDSKFKKDLYYVCDKEANRFTRGACKKLADKYYAAVKKFGKRDESGLSDVEVRAEFDAAVRETKRELMARGIDTDKGEHLATREDDEVPDVDDVEVAFEYDDFEFDEEEE